MIAWIVGIAAAAVAALLVLAATKPDRLNLARSIDIKAPPEWSPQD